MSTEFIEKARQELRELSDERRAIDVRMDSLMHLIQVWSKPSAYSPVLGNPKKEAVAQAVVAIVRERGAPVTRYELLDLLKLRGMEIKGNKPVSTLSTMLWRAGPEVGLTHTRCLGYHLKATENE